MIAAWIAACFTSSTLLVAPAATNPVRIVMASDTALELELQTAPSPVGGAVVFERVRFVREDASHGWRLEAFVEPTAPQPPLLFATAEASALEPLAVGIAKVSGDAAIVIPLHEGDAAICILEEGRVVHAYLADGFFFALRDSVSVAPPQPIALQCFRWKLGEPGPTSIRSAILSSIDPRFRVGAGQRHAAQSFPCGSDVKRSNVESARAALRYGQKELAPPADAQSDLYRWLFAHLELSAPTRGAAPLPAAAAP